MSRRWNRRVPVAVLAAGALCLAACGGGGSNASATKTVTNGRIDVNAYDPFRFDVKTIKAPAGPLTVTLHEKGAQQHTFTVPDLHFELKVTSGSPQATGTVQLEAGHTYSFKCSYDGHAAAGMNGQIVVTG